MMPKPDETQCKPSIKDTVITKLILKTTSGSGVFDQLVLTFFHCKKIKTDNVISPKH